MDEKVDPRWRLPLDTRSKRDQTFARREIINRPPLLLDEEDELLEELLDEEEDDEELEELERRDRDFRDALVCEL